MKGTLKEPKPIEKIELNEKNVKLRFVLFILCFLVVIVCAILIIVGFSKEDDGWTEIEASPTTALSCGDEFFLSYDLGNAGISATKEARQLAPLYTKVLETAYILLDRYNEYEEVNNMYYINNNINKDIVIDSFLYDALDKSLADSKKLIYLAPIYTYYDNIIGSTTIEEANSLDPYQNDGVGIYFNEIIKFINNDEVKLNLLGNNTINLTVSDEYIAFAKANEITAFIDFAWLKNSFIIDYVADELIENGFTNGRLSTYDGYFRNLDTTGDYNYTIDILDNVNTFGALAGQAVTRESISAVQFRNFMYYQIDTTRYYKMTDGSYRHYYIDVNDGLCKSAVSSLTLYSSSLSCSDIALSMYNLFICDSFNYTTSNDAQLIWCDNNTIYYTDNTLVLGNFYNINNVEYKGELVE